MLSLICEIRVSCLVVPLGSPVFWRRTGSIGGYSLIADSHISCIMVSMHKAQNAAVIVWSRLVWCHAGIISTRSVSELWMINHIYIPHHQNVDVCVPNLLERPSYSSHLHGKIDWKFMPVLSPNPHRGTNDYVCEHVTPKSPCQGAIKYHTYKTQT